jgi:hypothetical protein
MSDSISSAFAKAQKEIAATFRQVKFVARITVGKIDAIYGILGKNDFG